MNNILVVGGGGFVGKNLSNYLAQNEYCVTVAGRIKPNEKHLFDDKILTNEISIENIDEWKVLIETADEIIWLAHSLVPGLALDYDDDYRTNILPVLSAFKINQERVNPARFIYISTGGAIYGKVNKQEPINELHEALPISQYGISKKQIEEKLIELNSSENIDCIILRPSNIYGPMQNMDKPQGIIGYAIDAAINEKSLVLYNNGKQIRDFLYIDDFCSAIHSILLHKNVLGNVIFNLSSKKPVAVFDAIDMVKKLTKKDIDFIHMPARYVDVEYSVLDNIKFKEKYNWENIIDLELGIKKLLQYNNLLKEIYD